MALRVLSAGPLTTVQDAGRLGCERFGVPQSGAMDWFALRAANALVGNLPGAAGLEFALQGPSLRAEADCLLALAGCGYTLSVQGRRVGAWRAAIAWRGETIRVMADGQPGWGVLAVLGGIDVPLLMGSRSTYLRGGFGGWHGRALREEEVLPIGQQWPIAQQWPIGQQRPVGQQSPIAQQRPVGSPGSGDWKRRAGRWLPPAFRPRYAQASAAAGAVTVPVILGPQREAFLDEAVAAFLGGAWRVSPTSDRMGYRLQGPRLAHRRGADLLSEALAWGAVQVPADGQPIVMLADRNTAGGYPKIATVTTAGLPLLVQAMPGSGRVRFVETSVDEAQQQLRALVTGLEQGIEGADDDDNAAGFTG